MLSLSLYLCTFFSPSFQSNSNVIFLVCFLALGRFSLRTISIPNFLPTLKLVSSGNWSMLSLSNSTFFMVMFIMSRLFTLIPCPSFAFLPPCTCANSPCSLPSDEFQVVSHKKKSARISFFLPLKFSTGFSLPILGSTSHIESSSNEVISPFSSHYG
ncbi:hypothetical protein O6H91_19G074200 [Diphasiastrum complanatum]|uniref:Uncharacterized protein n=1 Tax=Diphasiastrum complanatum TaxID=34168 RepID=A0ACC2AWS6_DIPCM|nr:hypothetical protein O6H91_19G074200 [Diphasiastrum complanatum]